MTKEKNVGNGKESGTLYGGSSSPDTSKAVMKRNQVEHGHHNFFVQQKCSKSYDRLRGMALHTHSGTLLYF
jgi:hypothetical protein